MAIVEMKHVDMLALDQDKQALLSAIQKLGIFQITPADSQDATFNKPADGNELGQTADTLTRVVWAIGRLQKYDHTKTPFLGDKPTIAAEQAQAVLAGEPTLMQTVEKLEALEREAGELRGQAARVDAAVEQLKPWAPFSLPLQDVHATHGTVSMLGTLQKSWLDQWLAEGALPELCYIEQVSTLRDQVFVYALLHRSCVNQAMQQLKEGGFTQVQLPHYAGTAAQQLDGLQAEKQALLKRQQGIVTETAALAGEINTLKQYHDLLASRKARLLAAQSFSVSQRTFFLQGWVPADMTENVEARLRKISPTVYLDFYDATPNEEPPVLLHNKPVFTPFESIVSGFSLPAPHSFDPTAIMMPFYVNFMGMMVSDAGYGLMMAILIPLMIRFLKPAPGTRRMMWILAAGGVATVIWGALYNTWFGFAPFPSVFDPVNNALPVMAVCIGMGAIHLFTGLGIAAYMNVKRGKPLSAVADQLSWFLLVVGLGLMIVLPAIGKWVALTGAGIILVTAGREKSKNPFKRLISGLGALYGATSWVSDLLSYMRLFGMGLATGVIGMVINILVSMVFSAGPIGMVLGAVLFVGGHLFNAGINILGAYVHSCRLQYIEFFGKFYEDGGKPFTPLAETNRYVYIEEAVQRS